MSEAPTATLTEAFRVRVQTADSKKPYYLGYKGQLWRLKVYISPFPEEKAKRLAEEITRDNPGITATAQRWKAADGLLTNTQKATN